MLFWKAVKIKNCAPCHVHSQGLCYMWIQVGRPLNITVWPAPDLTTFSLFFFIDLLQVDLASFLASGARFLGHETAERATKSRVIIKSDKGLFWKSRFLTERNQHQHVIQPGDLENIFSHPRPSVSCLRRPGAVRAQPCYCQPTK